MRHRAHADQTKEWREGILQRSIALSASSNGFVVRTQAVAEALLATLRDLKLERFEHAFEAQYHKALGGKVAEAENIVISALDTLIGRLGTQTSKSV